MTDQNRNGVGTTYTYGTGNKVSQVTEASGRYYTVAWTASGYIDTITDSSGRLTDYQQNASGQLTKVVSPGAYYEDYAYDSSGRLAQIVYDATASGQLGKVDFAYDTSSRVTAIKQGNNASSTYITTKTYAYTSGQTVLTDGNSHATTFAIDSGGKVTGSTDALSHGHSQAWTGYNVMTATSGIASGTPGNATTYTYDTLNNRTQTKLPTGAAASAQYATGAGCSNVGGDAYQVKCSTDATGNSKSYDYDSSGNVTKVYDTTTTGGTGATPQRYSYASGGSGCLVGGYPGNGFTGQVCSSTDGNNNVTKYEYDTAGNLTKVTPPSPMGPTVYTYDSLGRILTVKDGNLDTTSYTYNVRDEILTTTYDSGQVLTSTWYSNGLLLREEENTGLVGPLKINAYNEIGWLTTQTAKNENGGATRFYNYTYDLAGNTLSYDDNSYGTVTYAYDNANRLINVIEPSGTCTTGYSPPAASSGCVKIEYDNSDQEIKRYFPGGGTVETTRDNSGRATRVLAKDGATVPKVDIGYSYTATGGDRTSIQTHTSTLEQGIIAGAITSYTYDSLNRLKSAIEKNGATTTASWGYSYDNAGNRTQQVQSGTAPNPGTVNYTYNADNQIATTSTGTAAWTFDAAGNQTNQGIRNLPATYSDRGAVATIGTATYTSWQQGNTNTVKRVDGTSTSTFLNSPTGLMADNIGTGQRAYTRTPDGAPVSSRLAGGSRYYYVLDSLGSVVGIFAKDGTYYGGYSYSPYGEKRYQGADAALGNNRLRYIGGYFDEPSSLYRLGARYYDPTIGRFTQYDPSGQEANPYAYAGCNPINAKDPTGLDCAASIFSGVVSVVGLVASTVGIIVGAPTLIVGAVATVGFIASATSFVYSVGDAINSCA